MIQPQNLNTPFVQPYLTPGKEVEGTAGAANLVRYKPSIVLRAAWYDTLTPDNCTAILHEA